MGAWTFSTNTESRIRHAKGPANPNFRKNVSVPLMYTDTPKNIVEEKYPQPWIETGPEVDIQMRQLVKRTEEETCLPIKNGKCE